MTLIRRKCSIEPAQGNRQRNMRIAIALLAMLATVVSGLLATLFLWPRPPDTTDPAIFLGDGAALDYCEPEAFPALDGSGMRADEIPKAFTPGCGWARWPLPVLAACTEPLAEGAADLRGLWQSKDPDRLHVERVEQCGDRVVVTTAGIIHDFRTDGTVANGSRDVEPPRCMNTWVAIEWRGDVLSFRPFGGPVVAVTRRLDGDELLWTYPGAGETRLKRTCRITE